MRQSAHSPISVQVPDWRRPLGVVRSPSLPKRHQSRTSRRVSGSQTKGASFGPPFSANRSTIADGAGNILFSIQEQNKPRGAPSITQLSFVEPQAKFGSHIGSAHYHLKNMPS